MSKLFKHINLLALVILVAGVQACTKTEQVDYEKQPANKIAAYRVTNAQQELLGAIDHTNNLITLYIPYYTTLDYLVAAFTLEDMSSTLLDATGNEIDMDAGPAPVAVGADPVKYIVRSKEGVERTYSLVQKILPHPDALVMSYTGATTGVFSRPANGVLNLTGNLESISSNGKFYLTNKATGEVNSDWITITSIKQGAQYAMATKISQNAIAGEYDVKLVHQGRSSNLAPLKLTYQRPLLNALLSSASYAPGDTIEFGPNIGGVFLPVKKAYIKVIRGKITPPAGFPSELYDTPIEMKIVSQRRNELKVIFPQMPAGQYTMNVNTSAPNSEGYTQYTAAGFGFYADYEDATGWGDGNIFCTVSLIRFTVK
ncbi:hypothetical protein ACLOAU_18420 [Niabella sp. CJ426]|uniref:hypothetical protein n=1 Tax=Niabella sp. CJ426 TaxID=3393740 RepID=UPI003CFF7F96